MTTNINVTIGAPTLRAQNRQQTEANRASKSEADTNLTLEQRATKNYERLRESFAEIGVNVRRPGYKRPKPAAYRYDVGADLNHLWYDNWVTDTEVQQGAGYNDGVYSTGVYGDGSPYSKLTRSVISTTIKESIIKDLVSADGSVTTQLLSPLTFRNASAPLDARYLAFPIGYGRLIVVTMGYRFQTVVTSTDEWSSARPAGNPIFTEAQMRALADSHPEFFRSTQLAVTSSKQRFFSAYLVQGTSVRGVDIPTKLMPVLALLNPEPVTETVTFTVFPNYPSSSDTFTVSGDYYYYEPGSVPSISNSKAYWNPYIYEQLNQFAIDNGLEPLLDPGNPSYKLFFTEDEDRTVTDDFETSWLFAYKTYTDNTYDNPVSAPRYDYIVARSVTEPTDFDPNYYGNPRRRRKIDYTTNGVSTAYCQTMALSLGFTAADFIP